jgi:hypothetical protein
MFIYFGFYFFQWPPVHTCRRHYNADDDDDLSYDSIRFRYFSSRFFYLFIIIIIIIIFFLLLILVVLVAAEVFLPIIFFVNWLGSHAAHVGRRRRRRRNELADRLPPPTSLPLAVSLVLSPSSRHSLYLSPSLSYPQTRRCSPVGFFSF